MREEFFWHQNESIYRSQILPKLLNSKQLYCVTILPHVNINSHQIFLQFPLLAMKIIIRFFLIGTFHEHIQNVTISNLESFRWSILVFWYIFSFLGNTLPLFSKRYRFSQRVTTSSQRVTASVTIL